MTDCAMFYRRLDKLMGVAEFRDERLDVGVGSWELGVGSWENGLIVCSKNFENTP